MAAPTLYDVKTDLHARAKSAIEGIVVTGMPTEWQMPIEFGNVATTRPSDGRWAQAVFLSSAGRVDTLGPAGTNVETGTYQITLIYPPNIGYAESDTGLKYLKNAFPLAITRLSATRPAIEVYETDESPPRTIDNTYRVTFTIYWRARGIAR